MLSPNFTLTPRIYGLLLLLVSQTISTPLNKFKQKFYSLRRLQEKTKELRQATLSNALILIARLKLLFISTKKMENNLTQTLKNRFF